MEARFVAKEICVQIEYKFNKMAIKKRAVICVQIEYKFKKWCQKHIAKCIHSDVYK